MRTIVTVQHTQSLHHTNGMVGSWTDWDLSAKGVRQAERLAERLAAEISDNRWALYSSDLLRARHTAEIIGAHLSLAPVTTPALRERNLGRAVGQSVAWLRANMECEERTVDDKMFSVGESLRDVRRRLAPFLQERLEGPDENILIVSHGDALNVFCALWLNLPPEALNGCAFRGQAGGVSFLTEGPDGRRVLQRFSDMSYLRQPL